MKRPPVRFPTWRDIDEANAVSAYIDWLEAVADAARKIEQHEQAGGDDWWAAHTRLYAALAADQGSEE